MSIQPEIELFWRFIVSSVDHLIASLDALTEAELNWRPLENANSLYILATHTMGNLAENLLGVLCGQPSQRQRDAEFVAQGESARLIQQQWQTLQQRVYASLTQLPATALDRQHDHPRRGPLTGRAIYFLPRAAKRHPRKNRPFILVQLRAFMKIRKAKGLTFDDVLLIPQRSAITDR